MITEMWLKFEYDDGEIYSLHQAFEEEEISTIKELEQEAISWVEELSRDVADVGERTWNDYVDSTTSRSIEFENGTLYIDHEYRKSRREVIE